MKKQAGFTLIEIMVTLVIVGILATVAGTALLAGVNGYMSAKENDAMAQKSQLAMARLSRELTEFTTIPSPIGSNATAGSIIVERLSGTGTAAVTRTIAIGLDGQSVKIKEDNEGTTPDFRTGDVLIDGVSSLAFAYYRGANTWTPGSDDLRLLSGIRIDLGLSRPDVGATIAFSTTVHPRNNGNIGGAALPASPPDQSRYAQCFVATAAYGDYNHPMVLVLREFRDSRLANSDAGRVFVKAYYSVGPSLAGLIEGSPRACFITRLALLPVVFLAYLLTQFPLAVPGLIFVSWIAARAIIRSKGGSFMNPKNALSSQKGAVLVAVVVSMVIFASLGAVMLNLFTTATHSQFVGNRSVRAYYLAEAGYRFAASQYLNAANEAARETALSGLHNQTFTLANNEGQFRFQVYPYWYKVVSTGGALLQANVIGQYPLTADSYEDGSWVQIKNASTGSLTYAQLASANPGGGVGDSARVDFTKYQNQVWESYPAESIISPVALTKSSGGAGNQTVSQNGDLLLEAQSGYRAFPRWNGVISVKDTSNSEKTLSYRELYMDSGSGTYKLRGITDPNASTMASVTIAPGTKVILGKFVRLNSRGIIGTGQAMEASRKVDFYIPVGYLSGSSVPANETTLNWSNLDNDWITGPHFTHIGSQEIATNVDGGGSALHVTATSNVSSAGCYSRQEAAIGLNWMNAGIRFDQLWQAAGGFLSYEVQVKMAVIDPTNPDADIYKNGINFALSEDGDSYGISMYRQSPTDWNCDGLPMSYDPGIDLSLRGIPLLEFWSKTVPGTESLLPSVVVDTPRGTGYMYTNYTANLPPEGVNSKAIMISYYPSTGDKVRFLNTGGALPSPMVANQEYYARIIYKDSIGYLYLFTSQSAAYCPMGSGMTRVCSWPTDGSWVQLTDSGTGTHEVLYDKPMWVGLSYAYLASSSANKDYAHLVKSPTVQAMRKWVTLVVRMKEAPSVYFKNGGNANLDRIRLGDTVYQTSDGTAGGTVTNIARVAWEPLYRGYDVATYKTWNGTARGALVLDVLKDASGNNRPILFDKDVCSGKLFVGTPPSGVQLATIEQGAQDNGYQRKGTWIQVFYADPDDDTTLGAPNTTAFDQTTSSVINRKKVERGTVIWPPDNVSVSGVSHITEANDYFTMLRWYSGWNDSFIEEFYSEFNSTAPASSGGSSGWDTIWVRNYASGFSKFRTPDIGSTYPTPQQRPELGLHATGTYGVWSYFDDFAVKLGGSSVTATQGFTQSFQQ